MFTRSVDKIADQVEIRLLSSLFGMLPVFLSFFLFLSDISCSLAWATGSKKESKTVCELPAWGEVRLPVSRGPARQDGESPLGCSV